MADNPLDPQDQQAQAAPQQGGGGGLMDRWNTFIDHPENRAGMMQFAVNMLAGKGLGESIGAAAEAQGRNVESQLGEAGAEDTQALKERETAAKESTAASYGVQARKTGSAEDKYYGHLAAQDKVRQQQELGKSFNSWLGDDISTGPVWAEVQRRFPTIKNKSDLGNPANKPALDFARQTHARIYGRGVADDSGGGGAVPVYRGNTLAGHYINGQFVPGEPTE